MGQVLASPDERTSSRRLAHADVKRQYDIDKKHPLGSGHFGVVYKCTRRATGEAFAIKAIKRASVHRPERLLTEIAVLRRVAHPHIIDVVDVFEAEEKVYIVTELCAGGELFDRIIEKTRTPEGRYCEQDAALLVRQVVSAVEYCHTLDPPICHRDLKPDNFLFRTSAPDSPLVVIDFGLSQATNVQMHTAVGTPYYMAPEVLRAARAQGPPQALFFPRG